MMSLKPALTLLLISVFFSHFAGLAQPCTTLGQTPSTAFPVCGITTFNQTTVPICSTNDIYVPGCSGDGALYQNKNPFWYKFTCYVSGSLGFLITPAAANEDYDWQLYDITGHNPEDVFSDRSLIVTGNWAGTYGNTGASATGVSFIQCASSPPDNIPSFAQMPQLVAGHTYLLMVSHFSDTQSGYALSFGGGTAVITDPMMPHLQDAKPGCDGTVITLKLNKKMRCNTLAANGSDFAILPGAANVVSAVATNCSGAFDFDEVTITLSSALPTGSYQLVMKKGTDTNTLLDYCDNPIPEDEQVTFRYDVPQPIFADSIGRVGCAPDSINIYFPKEIKCNTIAANGSDFTVSGPSPVTVLGAGGNCPNGQSNIVTVKFATPVCTKGTYTVTLRAGTDGTTVIDECGIESPLHSVPFTAVDTVSASFSYNAHFDCRYNTLDFIHDGAHDVNTWNWTFNNDTKANTRTHSIRFPASSNNIVNLFVSNGVCTDSTTETVVMDNEVKAGFDIPDVICPEDALKPVNTSTGFIDAWRWNFEISTSNLKEPTPVLFPPTNKETWYSIKQIVTNNTLNCSDSIKKMIRVLDNCFIAVPSAFTPNGDGLNEYLYPNNALKAENLKFSVYNRWGQCVFTTKNWQEKWDGKINGVEQAPGVYVWFLSYRHKDTGKEVFQKGTTVLIR